MPPGSGALDAFDEPQRELLADLEMCQKARCIDGEHLRNGMILAPPVRKLDSVLVLENDIRQIDGPAMSKEGEQVENVLDVIVDAVAGVVGRADHAGQLAKGSLLSLELEEVVA